MRKSTLQKYSKRGNLQVKTIYPASMELISIETYHLAAVMGFPEIQKKFEKDTQKLKDLIKKKSLPGAS